MKTYSIPEMQGMPAVPFDREKLYSAASYQAMYVLTEEEAAEIRDSHRTHTEVDLTLSTRYVKDAEYRARVDAACSDITASAPTKSVQAVMDRLEAVLKRGGKMPPLGKEIA